MCNTFLGQKQHSLKKCLLVDICVKWPQTVHSCSARLLQHVDGSVQDGRVMKEVADSAVYIKAIFSKDSLDAFQQK